MAHPLRRAIAATSLAAVLLALAAGAPAAGARGAVPPDDAGPLRGLVRATSGRCAGMYRVAGTGFCTPGPESRVATRPAPLRPSGLAADIEGPLPTAVLCDGDGVTGKRIQAVYARAASTPSRFTEVLPDLRRYAASVQSAFLVSAARTDGVRRPRWVTGPGCELAVDEVELSAAAESSLGDTITELRARGYSRPDRKYLIWFDAAAYCGIGTFWSDDRPSADNRNETQPGYARVDRNCWGWAESHEVMHALGAVQDSAPHSTYRQGAFAHCTDDYDVMCYRDGPNVTLTVACPDRSLDAQYDCGNDDYFHTSPSPGTYLAEHWNTADSGWLERAVVALQAPSPGLRVGGVVGARRVPVTVPFATRAPLAGLETIALQWRRGAGRWASVPVDPTATSADLALRPERVDRLRVRSLDPLALAGPWWTGPATSVRILQEDDRELRRSGRWRRIADAEALAGAVRRTTDPAAEVTFITSARQVGVVARRGPDAGRLEVWVDGDRVTTVDLVAGSVAERTIVAARSLRTGTHTVTLRLAPGADGAAAGRLELDAVILLEG
jgi:hypothetical protein